MDKYNYTFSENELEVNKDDIEDAEDILKTFKYSKIQQQGKQNADSTKD